MRSPVTSFKHTTKVQKAYGLNENLKKDIISKSEFSEYPGDYTNDVLLGMGLDYVFDKRELGDDDTLFIVEGGFPHIPFISYALRYNNVEPFLWVETIKPDLKRTYYSNFAYFSEQFNKLERGSFPARVFDTHSSIDRSDLIPMNGDLKEMGVETVVFLMEGVLPLDSEYNTDNELTKLFSEERESYTSLYRSLKRRFDVKIYEIDPRTTSHGFDKLVEHIESDDDKMNFLVEVWGHNEHSWDELRKILSKFKKSFF